MRSNECTHVCQNRSYTCPYFDKYVRDNMYLTRRNVTLFIVIHSNAMQYWAMNIEQYAAEIVRLTSWYKLSESHNFRILCNSCISSRPSRIILKQSFTYNIKHCRINIKKICFSVLVHQIGYRKSCLKNSSYPSSVAVFYKIIDVNREDVAGILYVGPIRSLDWDLNYMRY